MRLFLIFLIKFYQKLVSPFIVTSCCFYPTCSEYAGQAIYKYGIIKGLFLTIRRLLKCHPFSDPKYDPLQ